MSNQTSSPVRHFPVIRVFVSSTFSDLVEERNALAKDVWPKLEEYCRQRGFTFQAIDLRWGVPSEAGLDHRTMQICFEELHRAQEASPEPNFLILLGDKYGWRPLPETISEAEYTRLREHTQSSGEKRTLEDWYRRDANARPPHHILRARTDSPDGQDYTRVGDADGRLRDTDAWLAVQETLWAIVNRAYPVSLLPQRFIEGTKDMPESVRFQGSATEQEIWHGALQVENAREHVVAWFREIDQTGGQTEPSQLKRFVDLRSDQSLDLDAADALTKLKTQVEQKLDAGPIKPATCRWARDASGAFTGQVTTDHLAPMCEAILTRLRALILRQINDYWKADLSAQDATVGVVRGTRHELDLELRDHQRFARERGPVDGFVGRDEQVRTLRNYLQATTNRPLIVHGPSGSGKTALLAYVAQQPFLPGADTDGVSPLILTRFIGAHPESSTLRGLMTSLCRELRVHFPVTTTEKSQDGAQESGSAPLPDTLQKLIEEFYTQLGRATAGQPIYIFLDALDQLEAADQARECFWLRSQILAQAGEAPSHARIVASCLSPSPEFPLESEPCEPFRRLQSRGLLADDELGALGETAASQLLRRWLADQQRGLTEEQWKQVDAALRGSSDCRQPLYLRALHEQLHGWREFDTPTHLPASLSLLIQKTLTQLCQPNQHGALPRVALAYLVSARYGLSEGELLEVLLRDPDMQAQIGKAEKNYGHSLPPKAKSYPIAPWARLRSDLRTYLSERAAPGITVLSCYHRQVEQAVRILFLADQVTSAERRRYLADYFDARWDQPDAHALMELPDLLLALPDYRRLFDRLTNFAFPMRKAEVGLLETISDDYTRLGKEGPTDLRAPLHVWQDFFREHAHMLRRGADDQTVHNVLLQLALDHAYDSPVTSAAERWLSEGRCEWLRLQRVPRRKYLTQSLCRLVLEGHKDFVNGALLLSEDRVLSWSSDKTVRLWNSKSGVCLSILAGHTGGVTGALLLTNGQILSWSGDATLRLWDKTNGACLAVLKGHRKAIQSACQLPNGRILSWSSDATLCLWDETNGDFLFFMDEVFGVVPLQDGRILSWSWDNTVCLWDDSIESCLTVFKGHTKVVNGALALAGGRILSWSEDATLRLWDAETGNCLTVLEGHKSAAQGARELSDGRILSWEDATLRLWDPDTGMCLAVLEGHKDAIQGALTLANNQILSWSWDATLRLWSADTGACLTVLEGHTGEIGGVLPVGEGRILSWARSEDDATIRLWDASTGTCSAVLMGHSGWVMGALLLPDGCILSWSWDWTLRLWGDTHMTSHEATEAHTNYVWGALSLPDRRILTTSVDTTLRLWDATTGTCLAVLAGHTDGVTGALGLRNSRILSWSWDGTLRLWDAVTVTCLAVLDGHRDLVQGALSLPKGRILSWSDDTTLRLWDDTNGICVAVLEGHMDAVRGALPLPDGWILSWSDDTTLRLWDDTNGTCVAVLEGHMKAVLGVLPLPDGWILSWSEDTTLRLWDSEMSACCAVMQGHMEGIFGALVQPDGRILSWSRDKTLRLWDAATGACLAVLEGHSSAVQGALALPDGRFLSWSDDKTLRLWDDLTGACLEVIPVDDLPIRQPELLHRRQSVEQPESVSRNWRADSGGHTARLFHCLGFTPLPAWQTESDCEAPLLQPDGTLVVTQRNGQVCILKLYQGSRRVSLAEAEEILRSGGK